MKTKQKRGGKKEKYGRYSVRWHGEEGQSAFTVWGPGIRDRGHYVASQDRIRENYNPNANWTENPVWLRKATCLWGVILTPEHVPCAPKAREAMNLPYNASNISVKADSIKERIRKFWPEDKVKALKSGEDVILPSITDFKKACAREHIAANRAQAHKLNGGFKGLLESVYPGLYQLIGYRGAVKCGDVNPEDVKKTLLARFYAGDPISSAELRDSPNRDEQMLWRRVIRCGGTELYRGDGPYAKTAARLTGLKPGDFNISRKARKNLAIISESIVRLLATWAPLAGVDLEGKLQTGKIDVNGERIKFLHNEEECRGDLRIGNQPVEVKTGISTFTSGRITNLADRYSVGRNYWLTGEKFEDSAAVFLMKPSLYKQGESEIEKAGIKVIPNDWIIGKLREVIEFIGEEHSASLRGLSPRVHDIRYIERLADELVNKSSLLAREVSSYRTEWSAEVLRKIIEIGETERGWSEGEPPVERASLEESTCGTEVNYAGGKFLSVKLSIDHPSALDAKEFLVQHRRHLTLHNIRSLIPNFPKSPSGPIKFFDIESMGLSRSSPLVAASLTTLDDDLTTECLVARDYGEEKAVVQYVVDQLKQSGACYTWNGISFDLDRVSSRARANGVSLNGPETQSMAEILGNRHVDLYHLLGRRSISGLPDGKLQTFEKLVMKVRRRDEISGVQIPQAYENYVAGKDNAEKMRRVVVHNMLDNLSGISTLAYVCSKNKS